MEPCPVCGDAGPHSALSRYTVSQAAQHFCSETRDRDRNKRLNQCIRRLWQQDHIDVFQCGNCGFGFGVPFVAGDDEFYSILHEQAGYPRWRWEYDLALERSSQLATTGTAASLDIGAGHGWFLEKLGKNWIRYGVEGSATTRKILIEKGINVIDNLSDVSAQEPARFQLITMFQVLEHIAEFRQTLKMCRHLIHPQGALVISVPDGAAMREQERVTGCPDMPPNHIGRWSISSLSRALDQEGFETSEVHAEPLGWKVALGKIYLKVLSQSTQTHSLTANIYRIKQRKLRIPFLGIAAIFAAIRLIPQWRYFRQSGSFLILAHPR